MKNAPKHPVLKKLLRLHDDATGASAIEYGLILALISLGMLGGLTSLGDAVNMNMTNIAEMLNDSYSQTVTTTTGSYDESFGDSVSWTSTETTNANGSNNISTTWTDSMGNSGSWDETQTYNGAIGGSDWTAVGTDTDDGTTTSYVWTQQGNNDTIVYTNSAGQTATDTSTYNPNTGVDTHTDVGYDGQVSSYSTDNGQSTSSQTKNTY